MDMPLELLFLYLLNVFNISYFATQNKDNKLYLELFFNYQEISSSVVKFVS